MRQTVASVLAPAERLTRPKNVTLSATRPAGPPGTVTVLILRFGDSRGDAVMLMVTV
jgi:hypothetical protein